MEIPGLIIMPLKIPKRINLAVMIVAIYMATVFAVSVFPFKSWMSAGFGLFAASIGSLAIFTLLRQWEINLVNNRPVAVALEKPQPLSNQIVDSENVQELERALEEARIRHKELIEELNQKKEAILKFEGEQAQYEHRIGDVQHELHSYKSSTEEELRRKTVLLSEYQETINQQREVIRKKQDLISELESKVRDLNYEVKTLLQLAELGSKSPSPGKSKEGAEDGVKAVQVDMFEDDEPALPMQSLMVKTPEEASQQLKRCIDIAQKITGANRFGNGNSRFKDMPIDNRALDLRRLFDNLQSENAGTVIVYSQKEDRILFANNQTANLLGWNPDKFIKNFSEIIAEGSQEWKKGIGELSTNPLSKIRMVMKTKSGQNLLVHCHLGQIPTGAFRNHVIGVLFSS